MKVLETKATKTETSTELEIEIPEILPNPIKKRIKQDVGEYLIEQVLSSVGESKSPINGQAFADLSADYKKKKKSNGAGSKPNLENSGNMLDSLDYRVTESGIKIGVFGPDAGKADGHNNLSGDSNLPERRFLPAEGESYKKSIEKGVQSIVAEIIAEESEPPEELEEVESKTQLFTLLADIFPELSRTEITTAVLMNSSWRGALEKYGFLKWLK